MRCPWRYLTADGRVLECDEGVGHWGRQHAWHSLDTDDFDDYSIGWGEADPCAWDSTCPTCEGVGQVWGDCLLEPETNACPDCDGIDREGLRCSGTLIGRRIDEEDET